MAEPSDNANSGREAPTKGWRQTAVRIKQQMGSDNIGIVAAGVAFYAFLAVFPAMIVTVSIYGLVVTPSEVAQQLEALTHVLPPGAEGLIGQALTSISAGRSSSLSLAVIFSALVAFWSANSGMKALFQGINIAYGVTDRRGFLAKNVLTLVFTAAGIVSTLVAAGMIVALPVALAYLPPEARLALRVARWVVLVLMVFFALALLYRFAPHRDRPRWRWLGWGTGIAMVIWLGGSVGFSEYVSHFGKYNVTYGSLAAVVVLLMWFLLTGYAILLGAEINSAMEGRPKTDSNASPEEHKDGTGVDSNDPGSLK